MVDNILEKRSACLLNISVFINSMNSVEQVTLAGQVIIFFYFAGHTQLGLHSTATPPHPTQLADDNYSVDGLSTFKVINSLSHNHSLSIRHDLLQVAKAIAIALHLPSLGVVISAPDIHWRLTQGGNKWICKHNSRDHHTFMKELVIDLSVYEDMRKNLTANLVENRRQSPMSDTNSSFS